MCFPGGHRQSRTRGTVLYTPLNQLKYLKAMAASIKKLPDALVEEKVDLCIGNEIETVNKAILCAKSSVFLKMFQNEMQESKQNTVTIEDVRMPVLKSLISFLCTGKLPDNDVEFLCEVYYTADKYDISELHDACCNLLMQKVTVKNVFELLKMSISHQDECFKIFMMTFICQNFETILEIGEWEKWMRDDSKIAFEVLSFIDINE
ncbi:speckle-type POZ protein [Caerostris darwini]|uniref:Speckle-type POZ protein n=1 Tax=Caerostris darwini TaxID=1538125 RepID=A0AAV4TRD9_9ARAC|nr:speckle-type POZ protein [Caerostris darwini]